MESEMTVENALFLLEKYNEINCLIDELNEYSEPFGIHTYDKIWRVEGIEKIADKLQLKRRYHPYSGFVFAIINYKGNDYNEGFKIKEKEGNKNEEVKRFP